jgi:uncharacterized RDD family membrane protein YckC
MNEPVNSPENSADNPYAAPKAQVQDVTVPSSQNFELASRWQRSGAALIDLAALMAVIFLVPMLVLGIGPKDLFEKLGSDQRAQMLWIVPVVLVSWFAVVGYLLVTRGQSLGKLLLGTRIVRCDGSNASAARLIGLRSVLPYLIAQIPIIGPLFGLLDGLWIFGKSRQCLHDKMADTIVVRV